MLRPTAGERPKWAPRLEASMIPGPPPETTENPASESSRDVFSASAKYGWPAGTRALPNTLTAGRTSSIRSVASTNSDIMRNRRQASPAAFASREAVSKDFGILSLISSLGKNASAADRRSGSRRRHRHARARGRKARPALRDFHRRQGPRATGHRPRDPRQHHVERAPRPRGSQGEVRRSARTHARLPDARRRFRGQRAWSRQSRTQDRGEVDRAVRLTRRGGAACG